MFKQSFRKKIILYLSIVVLLQVSLIGTIFTLDVSEYTNTYRSEVVEQNLMDQIHMLNKWIDMKKSTVQIYTAELSAKLKSSSSVEDISNAISLLAAQDEDFINVYYTSESGRNVVSGGRQPKVDGREREWYKGAVLNDMFISKPYIDVLTGQYVLTISKSVFGEKSKIIGVLGVDIYLDTLFKRIDIIDESSIAAILLLDRHEKLLYANNIAIKRVNLISGMTMTQIKDSINPEYKSISVNLPDLFSTLYIYTKPNDYYALFLNSNMDFWLAIVAGGLGLFILLWYMSSTLANPIRLLSDTIRDITIGEYRPRKVDKRDEDLAEIIELFNQLDYHIKQNIIEIERMNNSLREANNVLEDKNNELSNSLEILSQTNDHLKQSEKLYSNLIDNLDALIWIADLNGVIEYANEQFCNVIGVNSELFNSVTLRDFIVDLKEVESFEGIGFFRNRDFSNMELKLQTFDFSREISVSVNSTLITKEGQVVAIQFIARNISDEKLLYSKYFDKNKELMIINDISRSLTSKEDLPGILQFITDRISHLLNVSGVTIRMLEEDGYLRMKAISGHLMSSTFPYDPFVDESHMGYALMHERIMTFKEEKDLFMKEPFFEEVLKKVHEIAYFPLYNGSSKFGVLSIISEVSLDADKINILKTLSENASMAIEKSLLFEKLKNNYFKTIEALSQAVEEKVPNYKDHTKRVATLSRLIAKKFYLSEKDLDDIYISGLLHDIGKLGVEDDILVNESQLTEAEEEKLALHVEVGRKILEPIGLNQQIMDGIYLHHKHYDLSGYPKHVHIERLPLFARIIGTADALDAHIIERCEQEVVSYEAVVETFKVMTNLSGIEFCPEVLLALEEVIRELPEELMHAFETEIV